MEGTRASGATETVYAAKALESEIVPCEVSPSATSAGEDGSGRAAPASVAGDQQHGHSALASGDGDRNRHADTCGDLRIDGKRDARCNLDGDAQGEGNW